METMRPQSSFKGKNSAPFVAFCPHRPQLINALLYLAMIYYVGSICGIRWLAFVSFPGERRFLGKRNSCAARKQSDTGYKKKRIRFVVIIIHDHSRPYMYMINLTCANNSNYTIRGPSSVIRNADGGGGCPILRNKALRRCKVQCYCITRGWAGVQFPQKSVT